MPSLFFCGADPNGKRDSSEAIQKVIDSYPLSDGSTEESRGGGLIYIPAGVYRLDKTLRVAKNQFITLVGAGAESTEFRVNHDGVGISGKSSQGFSMRDLRVVGGSVGIEVGDRDFARMTYRFNNVRVNRAKIGFKLNRLQRFHCIATHAWKCDIGIQVLHGSAGELSGPVARECDIGLMVAVREGFSSRTRVSGGILESNNIGLVVDGASCTYYDGIYFENNKDAHIELRGDNLQKTGAVSGLGFSNMVLVGTSHEQIALRAKSGGHTYRHISIRDCESGHANWDLANIQQSIIECHRGTYITNIGGNNVSYYGDNLGGGTLKKGGVYEEFKTLESGSSPNVMHGKYWKSDNKYPTKITYLRDGSYTTREVILMLDENTTLDSSQIKFKEGLLKKGPTIVKLLRLPEGTGYYWAEI